MKLINLIFILLTFVLNAVALETIFNPYKYLDYNEINVYDYNKEQNNRECFCGCEEQEEQEEKRFHFNF